MKIKHKDLEIPKNDPFNKCKLRRVEHALVLTEIVKTYADGFVLAINNEWGTGKTTFVKMWQKHLEEKEKFKTIYFNAWENDFDNSPLVGIMSELKTLTNKKSEALFKSALEKGATLIKNVAPAVLKAVVKKHIDVEEITDAIENTTKGAVDILEEEIKEYAKKKKTIIEFRKELQKFVLKSGKNKPLVFIIDELDRCRPNYAVEVLENLKHFFSVSGIVFVLSIDKSHLASSIKGYYGSEEIKTDEYLRRFIDLEYSLPQPSPELSIEYLYDYYDFKRFFNSPLRDPQESYNEETNLMAMVYHLLLKSNATLRQQEKIFGLTRLILNTFSPNQYILSNVLFFLIYIKVMHKDIYDKVKLKEYSFQELSDRFTDFLPDPSEMITTYSLLYIEALLIHLYKNYLSNNMRKMDLYSYKGAEVITDIKSKLDNNEKGISQLAKYFKDVDAKAYRDLDLNYLISKIELTVPFVKVYNEENNNAS